MVNYQKIPNEYRAQIKDFYLDTLIEKHEGGSWKYNAEKSEIFMISVLDCHLILNCAEEHFANMTIINAYKSPDEKEIVVRLKDYTYSDDFDAGYIAMGIKMEDINVYVTTFYHNFYDWKGLKPR
jgi:hypothetical protein